MTASRYMNSDYFSRRNRALEWSKKTRKQKMKIINKGRSLGEKRRS